MGTLHEDLFTCTLTHWTLHGMRNVSIKIFAEDIKMLHVQTFLSEIVPFF
jgi:hypothetical protein